MSYFKINNYGKNQYERFGKIQTRAVLYLILGFVGFSMIFMALLTWDFNNTENEIVHTRVIYLNSKYLLQNIVSKQFLSFGLDTSLLRDMQNLPIKNSKFINLTRHLAPAYVRIGGTSADCLYFNETAQIISEREISPVNDRDVSNFTINGENFEDLYNFATESKLRMIFDLNALIRNANGSWDDSNAKSIITFAKNKNMKLDWQLGNEPNSFRRAFNRTVTATQLAHDYCHLKQLLNELGYNESLLVGPEVNHVGDGKGENYTKRFLENDKDSINYVTWHQYYLNGREAQVTDFINISTFNYLPMQIKSMEEAIESSGRAIPMWLSETSTAFGGGAPKLSDRFVAGFLWLDKLGYSASAGLNVVTRQSLFGGNYAMIGPDIIPNPDWWVSVIYKRFVSEKVLSITVEDKPDYIRLYGHCTPEKARINKIPAITIYGVNISKFDVQLIFQGIPTFQNAKIFLYALTSDHLQSRTIKMNGKILQLLQPDGSLPSFQPNISLPTEPITLPFRSMVFIVIHGAKVPVCYT
ncbi:heparanase [Xylocopa sonorina]|uniref:heparanase n=1 Tax=Xylocopa sonorina TaxID=1818115 RepID=UPI00403B2B26